MEEIRAKHEGKPDRRRPAPNPEAVSHSCSSGFLPPNAGTPLPSLIYKAWHSGRGKVQVRVTFPRMGRRRYVKKVVPRRARNKLTAGGSIFGPVRSRAADVSSFQPTTGVFVLNVQFFTFMLHITRHFLP